MRPLSIFIQTMAGLDDLARTVGQLIGHRLVKEELDLGPVYRTVVLGIELSLVDDHGLVDDSGIQFSAYEYQLKLIALRAGMAADGFAPFYRSCATYLASLLAARYDCQVIVVANLQRCVASFQGRAG